MPYLNLWLDLLETWDGRHKRRGTPFRDALDAFFTTKESSIV